ncbi:MAG: hypothetical protein DHS20C01_13050 [marine bacterium B5-7]|nr:MAG: hypothetical protein DHS20C01_13050 [marine bacterium B5-7]
MRRPQHIEYDSSTRNALYKIFIAITLTIALTGCGGGGGSSSSGGGTAVTATNTNAMPPAPAKPAAGVAVVGPNLNGKWSGYYKSINGHLDYLSATITQTGRRVTITTTKTGLVHMLSGTIDGAGHMLMYDASDGEDWTTLYGPASVNSINLADYVIVKNSLTDTNILILKRTM